MQRPLILFAATGFAALAVGARAAGGEVPPLPFAESAPGRSVAALLANYFQAEPAARAALAFPAELDRLLLTHAPAIRAMAWSAYRAGRERTDWQAEVEARQVRLGNLTMPYALREVGTRPEAGWGVFIPMHGGGADKAANDKSWGNMQHRYTEHPELGGYLYVTPRAPTDAWNGFYTDASLALTDRLLKQLRVFHDVDPNRVYLCGYSHGGYGAFFQGLRMADRFAHVHASSAAVTEYDESGLNLRNTRFTFMIDASDVKHDRRQRCEWFDGWIKEQRGSRADIFPVTMEMVSGFGHGRVPDQNKLKDMLPSRRNPLPREISWFVWPAIHDMNWLHVPAPAKAIVSAQRDGNRITLSFERLPSVDVLLDERMIDLSRPVTLSVNGVEQTIQPQPSLRTLCETLAERGDPEYGFTVRVPASPQAAADPAAAQSSGRAENP